MIRIILGAIAISLAGGLAHADSDNPSLGRVHFPISCHNEQAAFDRGVALLSNFVYDGTLKAFQAIIARHPDCALGYWGIAMSEMPNPLSPQSRRGLGGDPERQDCDDPDAAGA